jgi:hypothetical protein
MASIRSTSPGLVIIPVTKLNGAYRLPSALVTPEVGQRTTQMPKLDKAGRELCFGTRQLGDSVDRSFIQRAQQGASVPNRHRFEGIGVDLADPRVRQLRNRIHARP